MVDTGGYISDESSFYGKSVNINHYIQPLTPLGDDNEKARLEDEVKAYDPEPYWSYYHPKLLTTIQKEAREAEEALNSTSSTHSAEDGNETSMGGLENL